MSRYDLLYKYSTDNGATWTDITDVIDSASTSISHSLCSTQFKSVMDTASFRLPAAPSAKKNALIDAIMGSSNVVVEIYAPGPVQVNWDELDGMWQDFNVMWEGSVIQFTGYVDKSSFSVKSYPLTADVTVNVKDVSSLNLDNKVDDHLYYKNKTITQLVKLLLDHAGYLYTSSSLRESEERTIPAFVIDKDKSKTYREYIDTLLFEAGGYVLDFKEDGKADIVRLDWKDEASSPRTVNNPMLSEGMTTSASILKEDGVKLTWSTLAEKSNTIVYRDNISRSMGDDGYLYGEDVPNEGYWPSTGYSTPVYQSYSADFLDTPYLYEETIKRNEDLSIIAVENVSAYIQATKNGQKFESWQYPVTSEAFPFDFELDNNPTLWPTKAWYLLRNNSGATVNLQFFTLRGDVTYRDKINESTSPDTSRKPKEYTSQYVFTKEHAEAFSQFYWHFLSTSRFITKWSELGEPSALGDVVKMTHKGTENEDDGVIVGKVLTWVGHVKKVAYTAVSVSEYNGYSVYTSGNATGGGTQDGATYTPSVSEDGVLSWTNDKGLTNPDPVDVSGEDAKAFILSVSSSTYIRDLRRTGDNPAIAISCEVSGYDGTSSITVDHGTYSNGNLTVPYSNDYDSITVMATLAGADTQTFVLNAVDSTEYNKYLGDTTSGQVDLVGDCYYNSGLKRLEVKSSSGWLPLNDSTLGLTNAQISYYCSLAQRDVLRRIESGSTIESDYAYFNTIIANCITADYISTKELNLKTKGGSLVADSVKIGVKTGIPFTFTWSKSLGVSTLIQLCRRVSIYPIENPCTGTITGNGKTISPTSFKFGPDFLSIKFTDASGDSLEFLVNGYKNSSGAYGNGVKKNGGTASVLSSGSASITTNESVALMGGTMVAPMDAWNGEGWSTSEESCVGLPGSAYKYGFFDKLYANELLISPFSDKFPNSKYDDEWSTQLPNGMIMKIKHRAGSGSSYAFEDWVFQDPFPTECLFVYATHIKTDAARDSYYYGFPQYISTTHTQIAMWLPYDYLCIAIGY